MMEKFVELTTKIQQPTINVYESSLKRVVKLEKAVAKLEEKPVSYCK